MQKQLSSDCSGCESQYSIIFQEESVSQDLPYHCPFCGELVEELTEDYIPDEELPDDERWNRD